MDAGGDGNGCQRQDLEIRNQEADWSSVLGAGNGVFAMVGAGLQRFQGIEAESSKALFVPGRARVGDGPGRRIIARLFVSQGVSVGRGVRSAAVSIGFDSVGSGQTNRCGAGHQKRDS